MNNLHPHWNSTDDVPEESSKAQLHEKHVTIGKTQISRRPAAFIGIALVLAVSVGFIEGVDILRGQLLNESSVSVTSSGFNPVQIEVEPGGQVAWTNEDFMPHIIASDTLCNVDDECLRTETILQGDTIRYDIPINITPGTYGYFSTTNDSIFGEIIVTEADNVEPEDWIPLPPPLEEEFPPEDEEEPDPVEPIPVEDIQEEPLPDDIISPEDYLDQIEDETPPQEEPIATNDNVPTLNDSIDPIFDPTPITDPEPEFPVPSNVAAELPQNPYTIGSYGGPPPTPFEFTQPETAPLHQGAPPPLMQHIPVSQPQTGAGLWLTFLASFGAIYLFMNRYLCGRQVVTKL